MNPDQIAAHLKRLTAALSPWQMATIAAAFVGTVAVVAGAGYWVSVPSYALLYSDLDAESAGAVVSRLKTAKIPYQLDAGGTAVRVPAERLDELRLELASQGLPTTGRVGFEIFDRTAFGTTDFLEQVNFRRGLEGELARTIATIGEVASARVHIALPKDSLFVGETRQAKASVVLKLRHQRPLAATTVAGIAGLVAASVESLRPEAVVIIDTYGRPLSQTAATDEESAAGMPLERQQELERALSAKVVSLLEPIVGPGRVRVNVSARFNATSEEQTEERWDPTTVIRSRQATSDTAAGSLVGGVAGARTNAPPPSDAVATAVAPVVMPAGAGRTSETVNYEVNKLTRHMLSPRGQLARLSVAVVLDDERVTTTDASGTPTTTTKPRAPQEVERMQRLVAAAVGLDPSRGDQITVENMAFGDPTVDADPPPGWWQEWSPAIWRWVPQVLRVLGVLVLAALAIVLVLRPMARALVPVGRLPDGMATTVGSGHALRTVADLEGDIEAELDAATAPTLESRRVPALTKRLAKKADEQPEMMAQIVRSILQDEER